MSPASDPPRADHDTTARRLSLLGTPVLLVLAALAIVIAGSFEHHRCQENCAPNNPRSGWEFQPDAWQWTGQLILACATMPAAVATLVLLWIRRSRAALITSLLTLGIGAAWLAMYLPAELSVF